MITKGAGDESLDYCELEGAVCVLVGGGSCSLWDDIKEEEEQRRLCLIRTEVESGRDGSDQAISNKYQHLSQGS